jgi:hypothetical protein
MVVITARDLVGSLRLAHSAGSSHVPLRPGIRVSLGPGLGPPAIHRAQEVSTGRYKVSTTKHTMRPNLARR